MGFVFVDVEISNPAAPEVSEEITMLVDAGATLSVLPGRLLDRLGVRREGTRELRGLARDLTRDTSIVRIAHEGISEGVSAVFGMDGDPVVMGVNALEVLGYQVDPVHNRLVRADMLLL